MQTFEENIIGRNWIQRNKMYKKGHWDPKKLPQFCNFETFAQIEVESDNGEIAVLEQISYYKKPGQEVLYGLVGEEEGE